LFDQFGFVDPLFRQRARLKKSGVNIFYFFETFFPGHQQYAGVPAKQGCFVKPFLDESTVLSIHHFDVGELALFHAGIYVFTHLLNQLAVVKACPLHCADRIQVRDPHIALIQRDHIFGHINFVVSTCHDFKKWVMFDDS